MNNMTDARFDDLRQEELDKAQIAFEKWADRIEKHDVMNRFEASRGWHGAIDYLTPIHNADVAQYLADIDALRRENQRLWTLLQCGQA